jgi:hypothetical protein
LRLVTDSDWSDYQRVEADITPTFNAATGWAGLIARYVDPEQLLLRGHPRQSHVWCLQTQ